LGSVPLISTSYCEPFHVARVVTSLNDGEEQNMGRDGVIAHDLRYDRADEFIDVVHGHWDAWEDDAII
jgi:alkanesulfonate monooxygenase SsuD/methylene tetrahydromethanopterin reductase-like flavin-dependent oxidoreductase (luciferase family)